MGGLDVSRLSSASAKDDGRGLVPNRGGSSRRLGAHQQPAGPQTRVLPGGQ